MPNLTYAQAITQGLDVVLEQNEKSLIFGEDVGKNGGVFRITDGLQEKYGEERVFDTPLAESGLITMSIGLVQEGFTPIPELQFFGFVLQAMDAIAAQISRFRYRYGGTRNLPITIRAPYGGGVHTPELHSDSLEGLIAQVPGIRVVMPATAYDAKGLLISAIESPDPVLFLEHLKLYRSEKGEVPEGHYTVPLDKANVIKEGNDITVIANGLMVRYALEAAKRLEGENVSVEVIDLRTVSPVDYETIIKSVEKTHRAVVVQEAQRQAGVASNIVSEIAERSFMQLDAPVAQVTAPDTVFPFGAAENDWLPNSDDIYNMIKETLEF